MQPTNKQILEWFEQSSTAKGLNQMDMPAAHVARMAYAAGADAELEGCSDVLARWGVHGIDRLRDARRPKPPSLKQQALDALGPEPLPEPTLLGDAILNCGAIESHRIIRRALESLPNPQD